MDWKLFKRIRFLDTLILSLLYFLMFEEGGDLWAIGRIFSVLPEHRKLWNRQVS